MTEITKILTGHLEGFWETRIEGVKPSFHEDGKEGYDGLHPLKKGDLLTIFADAARMQPLWRGEIDLDYNVGKKTNAIIAAFNGVRDDDDTVDLSPIKTNGDEVVWSYSTTALQQYGPESKGFLKTQHAGPYRWMDGIQKGIDPDVWGDMFARELPATLVKVSKPQDPA